MQRHLTKNKQDFCFQLFPVIFNRIIVPVRIQTKYSLNVYVRKKVCMCVCMHTLGLQYACSNTCVKSRAVRLRTQQWLGWGTVIVDYGVFEIFDGGNVFFFGSFQSISFSCYSGV